MLRISIDKYVLIGISIIAPILLITIILIFVAYMYHDKRKYASIDKFNEHTSNQSKTYNENLEEYNKNIEKSGVNHNSDNVSVKKFILNFLQVIIGHFKRDSK